MNWKNRLGYDTQLLFDHTPQGRIYRLSSDEEVPRQQCCQTQQQGAAIDHTTPANINKLFNTVPYTYNQNSVLVWVRLLQYVIAGWLIRLQKLTVPNDLYITDDFCSNSHVFFSHCLMSHFYIITYVCVMQLELRISCRVRMRLSPFLILPPNSSIQIYGLLAFNEMRLYWNNYYTLEDQRQFSFFYLTDPYMTELACFLNRAFQLKNYHKYTEHFLPTVT